MPNLNLGILKKQLKNINHYGKQRIKDLYSEKNKQYTINVDNRRNGKKNSIFKHMDEYGETERDVHLLGSKSERQHQEPIN